MSPLVRSPLAARAIGMDAAEFRRRNLVRREEMPYRTGLVYRDMVPITYDPADYVAAFDALLARLDYPAWRREQQTRRGSALAVSASTSA